MLERSSILLGDLDVFGNAGMKSLKSRKLVLAFVAVSLICTSAGIAQEIHFKTSPEIIDDDVKMTVEGVGEVTGLDLTLVIDSGTYAKPGCGLALVEGKSFEFNADDLMYGNVNGYLQALLENLDLKNYEDEYRPSCDQ